MEKKCAYPKCPFNGDLSKVILPDYVFVIRGKKMHHSCYKIAKARNDLDSIFWP